MSSTVKTLLIVAATAVLLFIFRATVCTLYTIPDNTLAPLVKLGDRVLVNRWSYGLRISATQWTTYARIAAKPVKKGDFIAFEATNSTAQRAVILGKVVAVPGDTVTIKKEKYIIPRGCQMCTCNSLSPYMVNTKKDGGRILVPECDVIGRVTAVIYNFNNYHFDNSRWFLPL